MYITPNRSIVERTQLSFTETRSLMSKVGVMMSADCADGPMSSHFGKAEWILIADTENPGLDFVKNDELNGKSAVAIVIGAGCTDVILADIGDGALGHLQAAQI